MTFCASEYLEQYRVPYNGDLGDHGNGLFVIKPHGMIVLASNGGGWEHVSVSRKSRNPSYEDMCWAYQQFWQGTVSVMQLHVPTTDHINVHKHCLHLWRPIDVELPRPPAWMVA